MRWSLRAKFSIWIAVFVILVMGGFTLYLTKHERDALRREMELRGVAIARSLAANAEEPLIARDDLPLAQLVTSAKRDNPGILYCFITDDKGRIAAHTDFSKINTQYKPISGIEISPYKKYSTYSYTDPKYGEVYYIASPIAIRKHLIGVIHVGISQKAIAAAVARTQKGSLLFMAIGVLLGVIGIIIFVALITRPLGRITQDIIAIGEGDLDRPILVKGEDEIGRIGSAVAEMAQKLKRAHREMLDKERMKRDLEIAQEIQKTVLPKSIPKPKNFKIEVMYRPSYELSGDYYEILNLKENYYGIFISDVSGKGAGGSLVTMMVRSFLKQEGSKSLSPKKTICNLNEFIKEDIPEENFVTVFYGVLNTESSELSWVNAGHTPGFLYRPGEDKVYSLNPKGLPVGLKIIDSLTYRDMLEENRLELKAEDLLTLYTDGVTDARDKKGKTFGEEKLLEFIKENGRLSSSLFKETFSKTLEEFLEGTPLADDICLLILKKLI